MFTNTKDNTKKRDNSCFHLVMDIHSNILSYISQILSYYLIIAQLIDYLSVVVTVTNFILTNCS